MTDTKAIEKRFLNDIKEHEMKIENDNEVFRSILFKKPDSSYYYFRITTWPNNLCISGDMGTFVFSRVYDMFDFFIMDKDDFNYKQDGSLAINEGYWHEKLQSEDKHSKALKFDSEKFEKYITKLFNEYVRDNEGYTEEDKESCLEALQELFESSNEHEAMDSVYSKKWADGDCPLQEDFSSYLQDGGIDPTDYSLHYIWCLYAIVWGIHQYKKAKQCS